MMMADARSTLRPPPLSQMSRHVRRTTALLSCLAAGACTNPLSLSISPTCAHYNLTAPNGWRLSASPPRVRVDGAWLNASDNSLIFTSQTSTTGADAWGAFNAITAFNAHFSSLRETTQRTTHVVLGRGNALNERAMKLLAEMTGTNN